MSLSRRKFMKVGVLAVACATLPLKSALGQNGDEGSLINKPPSSAKLTREQLNFYTQSSFAPYLNTQFRVYLDQSTTHGLKLVEVNDYLATLPGLESGGDPHKIECFSLLFTIPPGRAFEQDTYLVEHEALGNFYMFMVPVSEQGKGALDYYEAVVYRHPEHPKGYEAAFFNDTQSGQSSPGGAAAAGAVIENSANGRNSKTAQEVFYFRPQAIKSTAVPVQTPDPGAAGRRAASLLTLAQAPVIGGLQLGMTIEQVLALFPGSSSDAEVQTSLDRPASPFGVQSLVIKPERYSTTKRVDRVSQITLTFLDGRVSILNVGYDGPSWRHVDEFVAKFSEETKLPGADSWEAYVGMDTQLKTLRCAEFEISLFAGGDNVNINYAQISDKKAQQRVKERRARARGMNGITP
jgi:hypothetical protein